MLHLCNAASASLSLDFLGDAFGPQPLPQSPEAPAPRIFLFLPACASCASPLNRLPFFKARLLPTSSPIRGTQCQFPQSACRRRACGQLRFWRSVADVSHGCLPLLSQRAQRSRRTAPAVQRSATAYLRDSRHAITMAACLSAPPAFPAREREGMHRERRRYTVGRRNMAACRQTTYGQNPVPSRPALSLPARV